MDSSYYPLFLKLEGLPCLVVGGGRIAFQKAGQLVRCGARVTLASPRLVPGLRRMVSSHRIQWVARPFRPVDLKGVALAVAATDDAAVNQLVSREARKRRIWVNVVDQPALCTFIAPSVVRRGKLVIAISTGGASPALAKWIRKDLEKQYAAGLGRLAQAAGGVRAAVKRRVPSAAGRKRLYEKAVAAFFAVIEKG